MKITQNTINLLTEATELAKQAHLEGKELDDVITMEIDKIKNNKLLWRVADDNELKKKFNRAKLILILTKTVEENENSKKPSVPDRII